MTAAKTSLPVLGVPVQSKTLNGLDSLLSIVQMPAGVPVGTLAIGVAGATNAALLAAAILGNQHPQIRAALDAFRAGADRQGARAARPAARPRPRHEDRHHRRRPARTHAGARGLSARVAFPVPRLERGLARRPGGPDRAPVRSTTPASLERLAAEVDLVTYEFENVPVGALHAVSKSRTCLPPVEALRVSQDRLLEKELFTRLEASRRRRFARSTRSPTCARPSPTLGLPCVLKTRRLGYDGKGQHYLRKPADVERAWAALGGVPLILEGFVRFDREVSIIGARSTRGEVRALPARRQRASRRHPARDARAAPERARCSRRPSGT